MILSRGSGETEKMRSRQGGRGGINIWGWKKNEEGKKETGDYREKEMKEKDEQYKICQKNNVNRRSDR